jgi:mitochondrial fission protein ELM1
LENTANNPVVWIFADDRPGNTNQCIGVAEALGWGYEAKNIRPHPFWANLPNCLLGTSLLGLRADLRADIHATKPDQWPDVVIAGGRRSAPIARWIKKQSGNQSLLVQLMWPGHAASEFDLICLPSHDRPRIARNVLVTEGAPHRCWPEKVVAEADVWRPQIPDLPKPWISVLLGGSTKRHRFSTEHMRELVLLAEQLAARTGGSLLLSTSRRTEAPLVEALQGALTRQHYFYRWAEGTANPYIAMLGLADQLIVTGDSLSMCSEAAAQGKPLFIFAPPGIAPAKHYGFHQMLYDRGYGYPLTDAGLAASANIGTTADAAKVMANPAVPIAATIKQRLKKSC